MKSASSPKTAERRRNIGWINLGLGGFLKAVRGRRRVRDSVMHQTLAHFFGSVRYPYPLGAGSARPNPKKGAPDTEGDWEIETMVSEGARPWGRGRNRKFYCRNRGEIARKSQKKIAAMGCGKNRSASAFSKSQAFRDAKKLSEPGSSKCCRFVLSLKGQFRDRRI